MSRQAHDPDDRYRSRTAAKREPTPSAHSDQISALLSTLGRAKDILEQDCSGADDKFSQLAFALLEKELVSLAATCQLIRPKKLDGRATNERPEPSRSLSRPHLPRISTSDEALHDAVKANLPVVIPDPKSPPSRPPSSMSHKQASSRAQHRRSDDFDASTNALRRDKPSYRPPPSPVREPSPSSPPPRPSYPPLPKSRASSRRDSPVHGSIPRTETPPPVFEERRRPVDSSSRRSRRDILSGTSDSESSQVGPRGGSRARARSFSANSSGGRRSRETGESRRSIPEPSAPPFEPEPIVLKGEGILKAIGQALLVEGALASVAVLARVPKDAHKSVNPLLYGAIVLKSVNQAQKLARTLQGTPTLGDLLGDLKIQPLDSASTTVTDSASTTVTDLLPILQSLLSHSTSLTQLTEDLSAADWDVTSLQTDYLLPLSSSSPPHLTSLTSTRCWWELSAVVSLLQLQQSSLTSLQLAAAMDRDWSGGALLTQPSLSPSSRLTSLVISQVMHEDTLAVILRSTPALRSLSIGFQSIGSTDDDTPVKSIPLAVKHVSSSLVHLAIRAPAKQGNEETLGLLDSVVAELPLLEVIEFEETTVRLASKDFLKSLPKRLKVLRGRRVSSFGSSRVLDMLEETETIPVLEELDLSWAVGGGEGVEVYKSRHKGRIEEGCEDLGIKCSVGQTDEGLVLKSRG